jgi:hypothetical protein
MNRKIFKENDRLIEVIEAQDAKSCHRQLLSCFLGKLFLNQLYNNILGK